jgi:hypothetical protein
MRIIGIQSFAEDCSTPEDARQQTSGTDEQSRNPLGKC